MKKLLVILVAAALMALGVVGTFSSPAQAACPYSGCIPTTTVKKSGPDAIDKGKAPSYEIKVHAAAGDVTPSGRVIITCSRPGFRNKVGTALLDDGKAAVNMPKFKVKGTWHCTAQYVRHYPFKRSTTEFTLTVG